MEAERAPRVLLGITGCIAAYKGAEILRCLQKAGAEVRVAMTANAEQFVGRATFEALSSHPVGVETFGSAVDPIPHIALAEWCDCFLIAPCTANVVAKLAAGIADDLVTSTALACTAPVLVAPAMNVHMYENAATQANLKTLRGRGIQVLEPDSGYLACGETGAGRLAEPEAIAERTLRLVEGAAAHMAKRDSSSGLGRDMEGLTVAITAGPTREPIDAVRYVSNHSSGKMGYALAEAARDRGASVVLVSGPVALESPFGIETVPVVTADEMLLAARQAAAGADVVVCAAAVSDYRPKNPSPDKLKKGEDDASLEAIAMVENPDILKTLASSAPASQVVVGFAAETNDLLANAQKKLASKGAAMIVANAVGQGRGFGTETNQASLVTAGGVEPLPEMPKRMLADRILSKALELRKEG